ncbi:unnamed protein product [Macrosiphum euphorbiae]|uniref:Uncharacterized protein n=1 Tax=Macrosiphum euphorbiae TaxID=13131 RepID=A0AAV0WE18_9HEMI|nr:unnamed protein product [Macrosiphum euphorbiae]
MMSPLEFQTYSSVFTLTHWVLAKTQETTPKVFNYLVPILWCFLFEHCASNQQVTRCCIADLTGELPSILTWVWLSGMQRDSFPIWFFIWFFLLYARLASDCSIEKC